MTAAVQIQIFVPGKLVSPSNATKWTWRQRSEWAYEWRHKTSLAWLEAGRPRHDGPARITFTGYVARLFDDDNFPGCVKAVRDQAVRLICNSDDGPASGHMFAYRQEKRPEYRGVLITVEPRL